MTYSIYGERGGGSKALNYVKSLANKHNVAITGTAKAYSDRPNHIRTTAGLKKWYQGHGFNIGRGSKEDGYSIRYNPK